MPDRSPDRREVDRREVPRVLPDENLPRGLQRLLHPHIEVRTVQQQGWSGHGNGRLLAEAAERFDVLVTVDRGIPHHHDLREYAIGLVVLEAASNRLDDLRPLVPALLAALPALVPGEVMRLGDPS